MMTVLNRVSVSRPKYPFPSLLTFLMGLGLLLSSTAAYATVPDILGTYSGTVTDTESNCGTGSPGNPPLFSGGTETVRMVLTISTLDTGSGSFSGSGTEGPFSDGGTDSITFSGSVDGAGIISGGWNAVDDDGGTLSGGFSGNVNNGVMTLSGSGSDITSPSNIFCNVSFSGTLSLGGGADIVVSNRTDSATATQSQTLRTDVQAIATHISNRIFAAIQNIHLVSGPQITPTANGLAFEGGTSGLNAGDGVIPYGAWISYSYSDFDNDLSSTAFDGDRHSVLGGFDFAPWESTVIGVAVGYESSDIDTTFNLGNLETDGYTIAPYFGALLTDTWSVNFSFGYSSIDYDQFRTDPVTGARVTSSPDADRWFGMFNLNGVTTYGNWILGGRVGTLWAKNEVDAFTESDTTTVADVRSKLGTWNIGGDAAYSYGAFEPFVSATYEYDYSLTEIAVTTGPQPDNDRDDVLFAAGVRYFGANNGISGNLDWTRRLGRENFDEDIFTASIRVDF